MTRAPLLRTPRYSPDGTHLAFVDLSGSVGIVDLADGTFTTASFSAAAPPAWSPSGASALFSGLTTGAVGGPGTGAGSLSPGTAVQPLTPAGLGLSSIQREELRLVELHVGINVALPESLPAPVALPAVSPDGRIAYLVLDPQLTDAGRAWITGSETGVPSALVLPGPGFEFGGDVCAPARSPGRDSGSRSRVADVHSAAQSFPRLDAPGHLYAAARDRGEHRWHLAREPGDGADNPAQLGRVAGALAPVRAAELTRHLGPCENRRASLAGACTRCSRRRFHV